MLKFTGYRDDRILILEAELKQIQKENDKLMKDIEDMKGPSFFQKLVETIKGFRLVAWWKEFDFYPFILPTIVIGLCLATAILIYVLIITAPVHIVGSCVTLENGHAKCWDAQETCERARPVNASMCW